MHSSVLSPVTLSSSRSSTAKASRGESSKRETKVVAPWVCCRTHSLSPRIAQLANPWTHRALGTALEWPEAKKRADHVRSWGIKVSGRINQNIQLPSNQLIDLFPPRSNYSRSGTRPREKSEMPCSGAMRSVPCTTILLTYSPCFWARVWLTRDQVEYLVVVYKEDEPNVLLSLRQAEILTALASNQDLAKQGGCVPEIQGNGTSKSQSVSPGQSPSYRDLSH